LAENAHLLDIYLATVAAVVAAVVAVAAAGGSSVRRKGSRVNGCPDEGSVKGEQDTFKTK